MDPRVRCVAVDLETTGLIPGHDRIVEIGAVAFSPAGGVESEFSELVDPGIPIPRAASRVNGITDDMVRGRPTVAGVLPSFLAFLGDAVPVAHNAAFDVGFIAADAARLGLAAPSTPVIDTRALARAVFPGRRSYAARGPVPRPGPRRRFRAPGARRRAQLPDAVPRLPWSGSTPRGRRRSPPTSPRSGDR